MPSELQAAGNSVGYRSSSSVALLYLLNPSFILETALWTTTVSGVKEDLPYQSMHAQHLFPVFEEKNK